MEKRSEENVEKIMLKQLEEDYKQGKIDAVITMDGVYEGKEQIEEFIADEKGDESIDEEILKR